MTPLWASLVFSIQTIPAVSWFQTQVRSRNKLTFWVVRSQKNLVYLLQLDKVQTQEMQTPGWKTAQHQGEGKARLETVHASGFPRSQSMGSSQKTAFSVSVSQSVFFCHAALTEALGLSQLPTFFNLQDTLYFSSTTVIEIDGCSEEVDQGNVSHSSCFQGSISGSFPYEAHIEMGISSVQHQKPQQGELHYYSAQKSEQKPV